MAKCPKCGIEVADGIEFCPICGAPMQAQGQSADKTEEFKEMFEDVKDKVEDIAEDVKEKAADFAEDVKEKATEIAGDVKEKAADFAEDVKEIAGDVKEKANEFAEGVKAKVAEAKAAADADANNAFEAADIDKNKWLAVLAYLGILVIVPICVGKDSKFAKFHANQGLILFVLAIVCYILSFIPVIRYFVWIIEVALFALAVIGIINAAKGEAKELPVIGHFRFLK